MPQKSASPGPLVSSLIDIVTMAGDAIMQIYSTDFEARTKTDDSPVTDADLAAEKVILAGIQALDAKANIISEEATSQGRTPIASERFYLVDPLDGTREFLNRNGEFTVNIGLIENEMPIAGVVYAPAIGRLFWGEMGAGAAQKTVMDQQHNDWQPLTVRIAAGTPLVAVASRSHRDAKTNAWLESRGITETVSAGSSLKFCMLAAGEANVYPRFGRTMEWDTAAGHAVLRAAGGEVFTEDGQPLTYGKQERGFDNPAFIATADPASGI